MANPASGQACVGAAWRACWAAQEGGKDTVGKNIRAKRRQGVDSPQSEAMARAMSAAHAPISRQYALKFNFLSI
jgi:hypothetical protein